MPIELKDLRWAIIATQHRSLRQAAERLNIRQSTLSRRLRSMEAMLGVQLFERTNGGTRPTIEGLEFLEAARRIIEERESITARLKTRSRGESGRLTIGVHASLSAGNLRATLIEYRRRFPDVEAHLVDGSSDPSEMSGVCSRASGRDPLEFTKFPVLFLIDGNLPPGDRFEPTCGDAPKMPANGRLLFRSASRQYQAW